MAMSGTLDMHTTKLEEKLGENELIIVTILQANPNISVTDLKKKLEEQGKQIDLQYTSKLTRDMIDKGILTHSPGVGAQKLLSLAEGVDINEGSAWLPVPLVTGPEQRFEQVLNLFNIKGDIQRKVLTLLKLNPSNNNPYALHGILVSLRIDPSIAKLAVDTYFGSQQYSAMNAPQPYWPNPQQQFGYGQFQPQISMMGQGYPIVAGMTPQGQPIIVYPQHQPQHQPQQQGQQQGQPVIIKTGETRRVKRPLRDDKGKLQKDDNDNILYEEIEEPITLVSSGSDSALSSIVTMLIQDRVGGSGGKESDREKQLEKELTEVKDKSVNEKIEQVRKESGEKLEGLISAVNKNQTELVKVLSDNMEKMQHGWEDRFKAYETETRHQKELADVRGGAAAGEKPIVSLTREIGKVGQNITSEIRTTLTTLYRPGMPQLPQQMSPEQMAEEARKLRDRVAQS